MNIFKQVSNEAFGKMAGHCYHALLEISSFYSKAVDADEDTEKMIVLPFFGTIYLQTSARSLRNEVDTNFLSLNNRQSSLSIRPKLLHEDISIPFSSSAEYVRPPLEW